MTSPSKERKVKPIKLARYLGVSRQAVDSWGKHQCTPTLNHMLHISKYLGVGVEGLMVLFINNNK